jgi:hypothetical protein
MGLMSFGSTARATDARGFSGTTLASGRFDEIDLKAHTLPADFWQLRLKTQGQSDLFVQSNVWQPGGTSGWHSHPGPSLITITMGAVTAYHADDPSCIPHVYGPNAPLGPTLVDQGGDHAHVIRNETGSEARSITVQLIPPLGPTGRRIDVPQPLNCPLNIN